MFVQKAITGLWTFDSGLADSDQQTLGAKENRAATCVDTWCGARCKDFSHVCHTPNGDNTISEVANHLVGIYSDATLQAVNSHGR